MDFENLENMDKSEFLPLGPVKQELIDAANSAADDPAVLPSNESHEINSATTNTAPDVAETNTPICDSAEKQVRFMICTLLTSNRITFMDIFIVFTSF